MKAQDKNRAKAQKGKMKNEIKVFLKESFRVRALERCVCGCMCVLMHPRAFV